MGVFITVEGGEGCGKSTVLNLVIDRLKKEGFDAIVTREPGGIDISEQIRNVILDVNNTKMDKVTEALLYVAARRQHVVEKLQPLLKEGKIVISDRFVDSNLVYQGVSRGVGIDTVWEMNKFAIEDCMPSLTILFDLDPEIGQQRINANKQREYNRLDQEKMDFHYKVREGYLEVAKKYSDRIKVVDASKTIEEVVEEVYNLIKSEIEKRG